jgi:hypothetical protein
MGGSKKLTELTKVTAVGDQELFYLVDSTRAAGDQSVGISKTDLKASLGADTSVLRGGMVWVSGLTYESKNLSYSIDGLVFNITDGTQVTLDAAPTTPTFQRIDLIYGDTTGNILVSKGTESATPVANTLAFDELQLTLALLDTNGTEPEGVALESVYTEDAGQPGEWDATESTSGVRIDLASTLAPITGTKSIETLSGLFLGDSITLTTATPVNIDDFQNLNFNIKLKSDFGQNYLTIRIQDGSTIVYSFYVYANKLTTSDTNSVQNIVIFKSEFWEQVTSGGDFDNIVIKANYVGGAEGIEFILDDIYVNTDEGQTEPVQEFVKLAGDTMTGPLEVPTEAYGVGWNGSNEVPTKNDVYDKIETIGDGLDILTEDATVTGAHNIDWDNDTHNLTLTGNTTWTDINLPTSGTNTKVITLYVTGNFAITYPANWTTNKIGTYDGTVDNQIIVEFIKTGEYWLTINQPD